MPTELYGYTLREHQQQVLAYDGGRLAVSAVPGAGKTLTLALLAAKIILSDQIDENAEVLVVTVQNSAVANISQRIRAILLAQGAFPAGYRVCTLHKLASDILRARQDLAGVEDGFSIVDRAESDRLMHQAADVWISGHRSEWLSYLQESEQAENPRVLDRWRNETERLGSTVAKHCKQLLLSPDQAQALCRARPTITPWLRIGVELYALYETYLRARSGLDFDDLICRATDALRQDDTFLTGLRARWPFILEDEAQDSSPLQERTLEALSGPSGNWVRVGDPNQSINSTFTSADPRYFRRFTRRTDIRRQVLPQSGRCGQPIIDLANALVAWTVAHHPLLTMRKMAFDEQRIIPTDPGDAQRNPPANECHVHIRAAGFPNLDEQADTIVRWACDYARRHPERTLAILCPAGFQGNRIVEALEKQQTTPFEDLLRSTPRTRNVARVLGAACSFLSRPTSPSELGRLFGALARDEQLAPSPDATQVKRLRALLNSLPAEQLLFPRGVAHLRDVLPPNAPLQEDDLAILQGFGDLAARWARGRALPIDQLLLSVAQDLFDQETDLAVAHTAASALGSMALLHMDWRLADFADELKQIARNKRSLAGLSITDAGHQSQPGTVAVTTMHRAKGLEWDAVFCICIDSLEFPESCEDAFRDQLYFMPGRSPRVEATFELDRLVGAERLGDQGRSAVEQSRLAYIAERLRLLYVGITRAQRDLAITWSQKNGGRVVRQAQAITHLQERFS